MNQTASFRGVGSIRPEAPPAAAPFVEEPAGERWVSWKWQSGFKHVGVCACVKLHRPEADLLVNTERMPLLEHVSSHAELCQARVARRQHADMDGSDAGCCCSRTSTASTWAG